MPDPFTPQEIEFINAQVWKMIVNNGVDYNPVLVITPDTPVDWSKIRMLVVDDRDPANSKTCNVDLKHVLDAYGVNVEKLSQEVKTAMQQLTTEKKAVTALANQVTNDKGEVAANAEAVRGIKTTLDTDTVPHIDGQKDAVDLAKGEVDKAETRVNASAQAADKRATDADTSATSAANSLTALKSESAKMDALFAQMKALAARESVATVLIEDKIYAIQNIVKDGRSYQKLTLIK